MKRIFTLLLGGLLLLTGCSYSTASTPADPEADTKSQRYVESMDTYMTLTAYGSNREAGLDAAEAEILQLNDLLSVGVEDSEISNINRTGSGILSQDTKAMVEKALELYQETDRAFDITVYPLMDLWGFTTQNYHVPTDQELTDVLAKVGTDQLTYDASSGTLTLGEGQAIDLGGIAKGYTSQRIMELYQEQGVTSGMVSLGGNIQCLGTKPDGSAWRVGIQDPWGAEGSIAAVVSVVDQAVITSGGYERYFVDEETGITYRHILNPEDGYPAESGLASVSIISSDGMLADGLSTSLYILGLEKASDYWRAHSDQFQAMFICDDGTIYITEGLESQVESQQDMTVIYEINQ
jgi:thiamine biosynthesis lipoprotein